MVTVAMSKVVTAEYDAAENALRLVEPLEGVRDHEKVDVVVTQKPDAERPWMEFRGRLPGQAGEELAALVEEMFPTEKCERSSVCRTAAPRR